MLEIRIHGRGGQGGVTLAKLISTIRFLKGDSVQAFGIYAAERSGAPLQAFCRYDTKPITNRNLIYRPDHIIVLDPTLIGKGITTGLKSGGWILLNVPDRPADYADKFPGYRIATIDATAIARRYNLGTKSVPIVNTALAGAMGEILGENLDSVHAALGHLGFVGGNLDAASDAFDSVAQLNTTQIGFNADPPRIPTARVEGLVHGNTGEFPRIRTGEWATQGPGQETFVPPCNFICPAGNDVQGFLDALAKGDDSLALETLYRTTPFPGVCGRVCPAPCMDACNRIHLDGAVNVRDLERYAADHGSYKPVEFDKQDQRIAVVGSGPAGLSATYHLARLGYHVHLIERGSELGGLLRTGIPSYRLPRDVLDQEIDVILALGVAVSTNTTIDRAALVDLANEYDAVLVATGLQTLRTLQLTTNSNNDEELEDLDVHQGIGFLEQTNKGEINVEGEEIIVIGGGNTAFDAARSAIRCGASLVRIVYRRTRNEMPAIAEEIDQAVEEGVVLLELTQPIQIEPAIDAPHRVLTCQRMELGEPDESGRCRPVPIEGSEFGMEADRIILALGQSADIEIFHLANEPALENEVILPEVITPVYALGDFADNEGTVTAAIGSGRKVAFHVHRQFTGEDIIAAPHDPDRVLREDRMKLDLIDPATPCSTLNLQPGIRRRNYDEVHAGLADPAEAQRCMSCGVCNQCDRCITFCPEGVVKRDGKTFTFDYEYCKGCGICATECPRHVIQMVGM